MAVLQAAEPLVVFDLIATLNTVLELHVLFEFRVLHKYLPQVAFL